MLSAEWIVIVLIGLLLYVFISSMTAQKDLLTRRLPALEDSINRKVSFPANAGGGEDLHKRFAAAAAMQRVPTQVVCAEVRGDLFYYYNGVIAKAIKGEHHE